jgi:sec-independent protein translocase protein TatC
MSTPVITAADKQKAAAAHAEAAPKPEVDEVEASRAPLMDHLLELRDRLVRILWVIGVLFLAGWYVTEWVLAYLLQPLSDAAHRAGRPLDETIETVTTAPMEMIFVKLKMSFLLAVAVGFPFIAYQIYAFVAPGLYKNERSAVLPYLFLMPFLFVAGGTLVYMFVLPTFMDLSFSQEFTAAGAKVVYLPKVKEYYELSISLLTCFGFAFQLPIVISLLARAGVVQASTLRKGRKFALVVIIFAAMFMTPPDPFSWVLLSAPLFILYESGIIAALLIERGKKRREAAEARREEEEARREAVEEAKRRSAAAAASGGAAAPGE